MGSDFEKSSRKSSMTDFSDFGQHVFTIAPRNFPGFIYSLAPRLTVYACAVNAYCSPATVERTLSTVERDVRVLFKVNLLCVAEWTEFPG